LHLLVGVRAYNQRPFVEALQVNFLFGLLKLDMIILALNFELFADLWGREGAKAFDIYDRDLKQIES